MNEVLLEQYSEYLRLMGHRVIQTASSLWIDIRPRIFQPAPPFKFNDFYRDELSEVFKASNALACRWFDSKGSSSEASSDEATQFLYLARPPYDLSDLSQNIRHNTRRGLKRVEVRRVAFDDTTERLAYSVYADDVRRLRLMKSEKSICHRWKTWVTAIRKSRGIEFWAAWQGQTIVAFSVIIQTPWGTEFVLNRSLHSALNLYPNNALIYKITRDAFDRGSPVVSLGLSAFAGDIEGLHRFKTNMGFEALPLQEHQTWHPFVRPVSFLLKPQSLRSIYRFISRKAG